MQPHPHGSSTSEWTATNSPPTTSVRCWSSWKSALALPQRPPTSHPARQAGPPQSALPSRYRSRPKAALTNVTFSPDTVTGTRGAIMVVVPPPKMLGTRKGTLRSTTTRLVSVVLKFQLLTLRSTAQAALTGGLKNSTRRPRSTPQPVSSTSPHSPPPSGKLRPLRTNTPASIGPHLPSGPQQPGERG